MYAQITDLRAPLGKRDLLRRLINEEYLPDVREREGFVAAYFLEQIDDPDAAKLFLIWDNQAAVEASRKTGLLRKTLEGLTVNLPGTHIQRQGFIVKLTMGDFIDKKAFGAG